MSRRKRAIVRRTAKTGVASAAVILIATCAAAGTSNAKDSRSQAECTWGASSLTATYDDGRIVDVSGPHTSGCTSNP